MTIDRKEVFTLAWLWAKQDLWSRRLPASHLRGLFRTALVNAWAEVKRRAAYRAAQRAAFVSARPVDAIRKEIFIIECTDRMGAADYQRLATLNAELSAAFA
jgi:hypothetical protein